MSYYRNDPRSSSDSPSVVWWIIGTIIVLGVIFGLLALFVGGIADSWYIMWRSLYNGFWLAWLFPNGGNIFAATPAFWWIIGGIALFLAYVVAAKEDSFGTLSAPTWYKALATIVIIGLVFLSIRGFWLLNETDARYYNGFKQDPANNVYVVSDEDNVPNTLTRVEQSNSRQVEIETGTMPREWETRVASATGAAYVMGKTGDSNANTKLMPDTLTYIYGDEAGKGSWTAIRNGTNRQPIFGVSSWSGTGEDIKTCEFEKDYELNRNFGSGWGKNLKDEIAQYDLTFTYSDMDVYGYCDGDKPVIVIPGTRTVGVDVHTANQAYGVMLITGSSNGEPKIEFKHDVKAGELPGPVYPLRLVQAQRNALSWSAGRVWWWESPVGFEATDTESQAGNNADFLLKSKEDGRLYWVTPMKPMSTDAQTLVAYAITPADEFSQGKFNQQKIYVLDDGDSSIVNLNDLENAVTQAVAKADSGFFTGSEENKGRIVEFIPTSDDSWQVFAERGGRAVYRIDVKGGSSMNTTVFSMEDSNGKPGTCDEPRGLSDVELANCLAAISDELSARQDTEPSASSTE